MIKRTTPISMGESLEYIKDDETRAFVKKFTKMEPKKAKELREKLNSLEIIKLNDEVVSKLIDFLPKDKEDLSKVLLSVKLEDSEEENVLSAIKEFK